MTEQASIEPARPVTNLLIGIGVPAAVIGLSAVAAVTASVALGSTGWGAVRRAAGLGAFIGALASFYGLADIAIAYFLSRGRALNRHFRTMGYMAVWIAALAAILCWRY